ncbi:MAG: response regulator [Burkholderiales bacterium]|nr:response regulator [Burkholderiales bacterium]
MTHLFIVDDEVNVLNSLRRMLLNVAGAPVLPDLRVSVFVSPVEALIHINKQSVDLVISDYRMPEMDGVAFLARVRDLQPDTARIMLSACTDMDAVVRAINEANIFRFVSKPWSDDELKSAIVQVLAHRHLLLENRHLANEVRCQRGVISRQQVELALLERESPGITRVRWTEDGGVLMDD